MQKGMFFREGHAEGHVEGHVFDQTWNHAHNGGQSFNTTLLRYDTLLQLPPLPLPQLCLSRPPAHTRSFSPSEARRAAAERARASGRAAGVLATKVD